MSHVCDGQCDYYSTVAKSDTSDTDIVAFTGSSELFGLVGVVGQLKETK